MFSELQNSNLVSLELQMRKVIAILAASTIAISAASAGAASALAEPQRALSTRQLEIQRNVASVDGYIDKALHDEFWSLMPPIMRNSPSAQRVLERMFLELGQAGRDFQEQTWLSARESLNAQRIVRTEAYLRAKEAALKASSNPSYQSSVRKSTNSGERILLAAASGTALDLPNGRTFVLRDLIDHILY